MPYGFFVFEGIDGSGKDTQLERFVKMLRKKDKYAQIFITREPSKTTSAGREIAERLRSNGFDSDEHALSLYVRDRAERQPLYADILSVANIVTSRYDLSTYAYQKSENLTFQKIRGAHEKAYSDLGVFETKPDITFLFDIPAETVMARIEERNEDREVFETLEKLEKSRRNYLDAAKFLAETKGRKIVIIDASKNISEVESAVWNAYAEHLKTV